MKDFCAQVQKNIRDIYGKDENAPAESTPIPCLACGNPGLVVLFVVRKRHRI